MTVFEVTHINNTKYTLTTTEWEKVRFDIEGERYQVVVNLYSDSYPYWDEYWCKKIFNKPDTYQNKPYITPEEYGFADAYPTDVTTKEQFQKHTIRDFDFETRRYRVGYIHNEDIVMSCIRADINEAFIEYRFETALNRIDVELSHWRDQSYDWLSKSNGTAVVQQYIKNGWVTVLGLLSDETNLPRNRNEKNTYKIEFLQPAYRIRFYSSSTMVTTSDSNRGRISIGTMSFYESKYNLPLSGAELDYEPNKWNNVVVSKFLWIKTYVSDLTNCYSYAVNAQINPTTNKVEHMQPGQSIGKSLKEEEIPNTNTIVSYIKGDAEKLGFGFTSLEENEACPDGYYKVAFVIDNQYSYGDGYRYDYHWYRQNSDGTWSHKPGNTPVTNLDASNQIIMNPRLADRNLGDGLNYNLFVGYFAVKPLNLMYQ